MLNIRQIDKSSLYNHYLYLIQLSQNHPALSNGKLVPVNLNNKQLLAYQLSNGEKNITVIHNVSSQKGTVPEKALSINNNFIHGKETVSKENSLWVIEPLRH